MRNFKYVGNYLITYRNWAVRKHNDIENGFRISVEFRGNLDLDYYIPPPYENLEKAYNIISSYLHSSRRGVALPARLAPKMGNIAFVNMRGGF